MKAEIKDTIIGVRFSSYEADVLDRIARRLGWSRSQLLRELFSRFIDAHPDPVKELQR